MISDFREPAPDQSIRFGLTLAIRNNNPGNIRPGQHFRGEVGENGGFSVFVNMAYGIRAYLVIYRAYIVKDGVKNIADFIHRWAPPSDNNPNNLAYVKAICDATGLNSLSKVPQDKTTVEKFAIAQWNFESGNQAGNITLMDIDMGFVLFNHDYPGFFL